MPPAAARRHPVDLLLCGHHYRASEAALRAAGATAYDRDGTLILPAAGGTGQVPDCEPVAAGRHQATRRESRRPRRGRRQAAAPEARGRG
jgi:hypothetical protein